MGILQIFTLLGALGMFLYGMNLMSSGLQKSAGDRLRTLLSAMTSNPFKGVLTGLSITSIIQSSSATTVMVVSFVNAGLLTLAQAIGVIMGANIGTTVTAWLVSWLGFKSDISILAVPLMLFGFLFSNSKKDKRKNIGELIVGFSLLFLGLSFMKESVPDLGQTPEVLEFVRSWSGHGFGSVFKNRNFCVWIVEFINPLDKLIYYTLDKFFIGINDVLPYFHMRIARSITPTRANFSSKSLTENSFRNFCIHFID